MKWPELINVTVVPAAVGYKAVYVNPYDDEDVPEKVEDLWMSSIIGWRVQTYQRDNREIYSHTDAITIEGSSDSDYVVLAPDGSVADTYSSDHATIEGYLAHAKEAQAGIRALRAAQKETSDGKDA
jgi:hypothetical protein